VIDKSKNIEKESKSELLEKETVNPEIKERSYL